MNCVNEGLEGVFKGGWEGILCIIVIGIMESPSCIMCIEGGRVRYVS